MTTRNLDALFSPRRIALIGASDRPGSVGEVLAGNLLGGGFAGEIDLVDATGRPVRGRPVVRAVRDLPQAPDLAVVATPASTIPGVISDLGARGCRAAVVISAGFEGDGAAADALRRSLLEAARPHLLRIVGPNCLGVLSPGIGLNASFARGTPPPGGLALVSQSGAVAAAALDWGPAHGLGFSRVVTLGDSFDVDIGDVVEVLAADPDTRAILLYVESLRDARKFMRTARGAAQVKPVIALKGGRSDAGARAAFSHTRALAGSDAVYAAAFRRAGVLQVDGLDDLLDMALLIADGRAGAGPLALLTNGGGAAVLAVDALERCGGRIAALQPATQALLRDRLPANGACANPVDILGDAGPDRYGAALEVLLSAPEVGAVLAINCPTAVADSDAAAAAVVEARAASGSGRRVLAAWLGEPSVAAGRARLAAAGVATYPTAEAAVRAYARLETLDQRRRLLPEAPPSTPGDVDAARAIVARALSAGRTALHPLEVGAMLRAYGVATIETRQAATPREAGQAARALGGAVALKVQSRDISHKSDVHGVVLGLQGQTRTLQAARAMRRHIRSVRPDARLDGFIVQPMIQRPLAQEILAGVVRDPAFGPVVVVGHGGVAVEVLADRALGLPPLNRALARDMIGQTRVAWLLAGFRDRPAADLDALADLLVALGQLALDLPEVVELDLNPVLCDASGALALDARIAVRAVDRPAAPPAMLPPDTPGAQTAARQGAPGGG